MKFSHLGVFVTSCLHAKVRRFGTQAWRHFSTGSLEQARQKPIDQDHSRNSHDKTVDDQRYNVSADDQSFNAAQSDGGTGCDNFEDAHQDTKGSPYILQTQYDNMRDTKLLCNRILKETEEHVRDRV